MSAFIDLAVAVADYHATVAAHTADLEEGKGDTDVDSWQQWDDANHAHAATLAAAAVALLADVATLATAVRTMTDPT